MVRKRILKEMQTTRREDASAGKRQPRRWKTKNGDENKHERTNGRKERGKYFEGNGMLYDEDGRKKKERVEIRKFSH